MAGRLLSRPSRPARARPRRLAERRCVRPALRPVAKGSSSKPRLCKRAGSDLQAAALAGSQQRRAARGRGGAGCASAPAGARRWHGAAEWWRGAAEEWRGQQRGRGWAIHGRRAASAAGAGDLPGAAVLWPCAAGLLHRHGCRTALLGVQGSRGGPSGGRGGSFGRGGRGGGGRRYSDGPRDGIIANDMIPCAASCTACTACSPHFAAPRPRLWLRALVRVWRLARLCDGAARDARAAGVTRCGCWAWRRRCWA